MSDPAEPGTEPEPIEADSAAPGQTRTGSRRRPSDADLPRQLDGARPPGPEHAPPAATQPTGRERPASDGAPPPGPETATSGAAPPLEELLDLARDAVEAAVTGRRPPVPDLAAIPALATAADAFVTLTANGDLRGCMGTLGADLPVGRAVVHAAGMAAVEDPRFWPVGPGELARLRLEVSVLGAPRALPDVADFVAGRDGIVVEARGRRALLLPQVASEMGWGSEEMLNAVCEKAGLRRDAWREPTTRLSTFEVARIAGPAVPPRVADRAVAGSARAPR